MANRILDGLNEQQLAAVTETEGYVRLIAGAGSGKTRTLTRRFAYITQTLGVSPANVLCVTFTNKAASEMRNRIKDLTGDNAAGMITTFHGFCNRVLKEDIHRISYPKTFMIMDPEDQKQMVRKVMEDMGLALKDYRIKHIVEDMIGPKKGAALNYVALLAATGNASLEECIAKSYKEDDEIFYRYLLEQKKSFALDFDDLIYFVLYIFSQHRPTLQKWQHRLEYIMVDEFQDVDDTEYALVSQLAGEHHNLFIVGDPDQTIYTWRGAKVDYIMNFDQLNPGCKTLMLTSNYRSTPQIVSVTNSLISHNRYRIDKQLEAVKANGARVIYSHSRTDKEEAQYIGELIQFHHAAAIPYSSVAILYRAHHISRFLEEELLSRNIPYRVYGGVGFYERREIKDALCYLRMLTSADDLALARIINTPRRGISRTKLGQLKEFAESRGLSLYTALCRCVEENSPIINRTRAAEFVDMIEGLRERTEDYSVCALLEQLMAASGYERMLRIDGDQDRLDNLAELKQSISQYEKDEGETVNVTDYLAAVTLMTAADEPDNSDSVKLMTVHAAKGLEFRVVFVCELCEGIFPSRRTNTRDKMEEERRLAYVALTRARDALYITDSEGLTLDGSIKYPSRFVFDIDRPLIEYTVELSEDLVQQATAVIEKDEGTLDMIQYKTGDRITHPVFGEGEIIERNEKNSCYVVRFSGDRTRSISFSAEFLKNGQ